MRTLSKKEMKAVSGGSSCNSWPYNSYNCYTPTPTPTPRPKVCVEWARDPNNYGGAYICVRYK